MNPADAQLWLREVEGGRVNFQGPHSSLLAAVAAVLRLPTPTVHFSSDPKCVDLWADSILSTSNEETCSFFERASLEAKQHFAALTRPGSVPRVPSGSEELSPSAVVRDGQKVGGTCPRQALGISIARFERCPSGCQFHSTCRAICYATLDKIVIYHPRTSNRWSANRARTQLLVDPSILKYFLLGPEYKGELARFIPSSEGLSHFSIQPLFYDSLENCLRTWSATLMDLLPLARQQSAVDVWDSGPDYTEKNVVVEQRAAVEAWLALLHHYFALFERVNLSSDDANEGQAQLPAHGSHVPRCLITKFIPEILYRRMRVWNGCFSRDLADLVQRPTDLFACIKSSCMRLCPDDDHLPITVARWLGFDVGRNDFDRSRKGPSSDAADLLSSQLYAIALETLMAVGAPQWDIDRASALLSAASAHTMPYQAKDVRRAFIDLFYGSTGTEMFRGSLDTPLIPSLDTFARHNFIYPIDLLPPRIRHMLMRWYVNRRTFKVHDWIRMSSTLQSALTAQKEMLFIPSSDIVESRRLRRSDSMDGWQEDNLTIADLDVTEKEQIRRDFADQFESMSSDAVRLMIRNTASSAFVDDARHSLEIPTMEWAT